MCRSSKQPVFLADRDETNGIFDGVFGDGQSTRVGITLQSTPALKGMVNGLDGAAAGGHVALFGQ